MKTAHYIVTIHNKEDLINKVLEGIVTSTKDSTYFTNIICVLDGCTDNSEQYVLEFAKQLDSNYKLYTIIQNDVHELLSINAALRFIQSLDGTPDDLIFFLQDDVVLKDENLNEMIEYLYQQQNKLGYVSFRCGLATSLDSSGILCEHSFIESTHGHWKQLNLNHFVEMQEREFSTVEIAIKSPTCIKKGVLDEVGMFDEALQPFGHDDLDLCIRLNKLGYSNAVFGVKFESKLDWGGTREDKNQDKGYHKNYASIVSRNKVYLTNKHREYYESKLG